MRILAISQYEISVDIYLLMSVFINWSACIKNYFTFININVRCVSWDNY